MLVYLADLAHNKSIDSRSIPMPLGIGYVKAYLLENIKTDIKVELFKDPEKFLEKSIKNKPDIIGIANYGWNQNLNEIIGKYLKNKLKSTFFIGGGPNIDEDPILQLRFLKKHSYLDYYIVDGGEEPFFSFVEWVKSDQKMTNLPNNIIYNYNNKLCKTDLLPLVKNITNIPSPYLNGYLDEFLEEGMVPLFETNRGCPFKCTFCAWGSASKDLVRRMDFDVSLEEIEYVSQRSKAVNWIFCDANFGILKRDVEIAKKIKESNTKSGFPKKCHMWLSKNTNDRNIEIADILGDMIVPVMAVQSLDQQVLQNIKRSNISTDTYTIYQQKFHKIGHKTYSDLIIPLPGETINSHYEGLRKLFDLDVDIITNHNMRLLPGAEINSIENRKKYGFKTKYRLIHGDHGVYKTPHNEEIKIIEYEESLRETNSMKENDIFKLRKVHFMIDVFWNTGVYKMILSLAKVFHINPINIILQFLTEDKLKLLDKELKFQIQLFFKLFDEESTQEWFDSEEHIKEYFDKEENFNKILQHKFEKLNIKFSILLLKNFKTYFDKAILKFVSNTLGRKDSLILHYSNINFKLFPAINENCIKNISLPTNLFEINPNNLDEFRLNENHRKYDLFESKKRVSLKRLLKNNKGTISKIFNTQRISLKDLKINHNIKLDNNNFFSRSI